MKKLYPMGVIFLIFVVGIGFILYPSIGNFVTLNTASITISEYEKVVEEAEQLEPTVQERLRQAQLYNQHLYYGTDVEDEDKCLNVNEDVICYLDIPKISVYLPVYYGTSEDVLKKGCGYIEHTSLPVGGTDSNAAISGHTGLPGAALLSELDQLVEGDVFYIHVLGEILAYEVELVDVVAPEDSEDLKIVPGRDLVTLVTCTPYGINSHRLIVRGERIPYVEEEQQVMESGLNVVEKGLSDAMLRQLAVIGGIVFVAVVAVVSACIYRRRVISNSNQKDEEQ